MAEEIAEIGRAPKLSRRQRELEFRKNIVLDAAEEVFADSTYAQASVEDIAQRAEISVGTLYNLFRSKEEIYKSVVSRSLNQFFANITEAIAEARGPHEKVRACVRYYLEHFQRYSRQMRLYASATNGVQWELKSKLSEDAVAGQMGFLTSLTDICQQGMDDGIFKRGAPASLLAVTIANVPHAFLMAWLDGNEGEPLDMLPHALTIVDRIMGVDAE